LAFELKPLPYDYNALEPHIDEQTMRLHHDKHHQAYTDGLNGALEKAPDLMGKPIEEILMNIGSVPEAVRGAVNFHGGGFENHNIFWSTMGPNAGGTPGGALSDAINTAFGSFDGFKEKLSGAAGTIQGSGWAWLVYNPTAKGLDVKQFPNQTSPYTENLIPLVGIDMWEHAFYLKYQNRKAEYIEAWYNVVNWGEVAQRFEKATS